MHVVGDYVLTSTPWANFTAPITKILLEPEVELTNSSGEDQKINQIYDGTTYDENVTVANELTYKWSLPVPEDPEGTDYKPSYHYIDSSSSDSSDSSSTSQPTEPTDSMADESASSSTESPDYDVNSGTGSKAVAPILLIALAGAVVIAKRK